MQHTEDELHPVACWQIANGFNYAYMLCEITHTNVLRILIGLFNDFMLWINIL